VVVALKRSLVVNIPGVSENSCFNGFSRNTAIAMNLDPSNHVLLTHGCGAQQEKSQQETQERMFTGSATLYK
jgi:hypothetical protein